MATLAVLRKRAAAKYGLSRYGDEDPIFNQIVLNDAVNEAHRWLAEAAKLYRKTVTADLPIGSGGISTVTLDTAMFEVDPYKVRIQASTGSDWNFVPPADEDFLLKLDGPVENAESGTPGYYWLRTIETADASRQLVLYPGATATVTNGLKYDGWVYPAELSSDSGSPPFNSNEHDLLLPVICWKMAEHELGRGRPDAASLVTYWQRQAEQACADLKDRLARYRTPGTRMAHWRPVDFF